MTSQIKVIITRRVTQDKTALVEPLIAKLRSLAVVQPGYISGETLKNLEEPEDFLVISSWKDFESWRGWFEHAKRREVQSQIDNVLGTKTSYRIYQY